MGPVPVAAAPAVLTLGDGRTGSSFDYSIPPRASYRIATSNPSGRATSGSVRATPNRGTAAPSGLVVFSFTSGGKTVSEAGVPALSPGSAFRVYGESSGTPNQPGSIRTGLAITNAAHTDNSVTLEVMHLDGSMAVAPVSLVLAPSGQVARFLDEIFGSLPGDFSGVLRVTSTADVAIVGLRLRFNDRGELKMTTTPPSNETDPPTMADRFFPHIVDSAGWSTQFILFSGTARQTSSGTLNFIDTVGEPWDLLTAYRPEVTAPETDVGSAGKYSREVVVGDTTIGVVYENVDGSVVSENIPRKYGILDGIAKVIDGGVSIRDDLTSLTVIRSLSAQSAADREVLPWEEAAPLLAQVLANHDSMDPVLGGNEREVVGAFGEGGMLAPNALVNSARLATGGTFDILVRFQSVRRALYKEAALRAVGLDEARRFDETLGGSLDWWSGAVAALGVVDTVVSTGVSISDQLSEISGTEQVAEGLGLGKAANALGVLNYGLEVAEGIADGAARNRLLGEAAKDALLVASLEDARRLLRAENRDPAMIDGLADAIAELTTMSQSRFDRYKDATVGALLDSVDSLALLAGASVLSGGAALVTREAATLNAILDELGHAVLAVSAMATLGDALRVETEGLINGVDPGGASADDYAVRGLVGLHNRLSAEARASLYNIVWKDRWANRLTLVGLTTGLLTTIAEWRTGQEGQEENFKKNVEFRIGRVRNNAAFIAVLPETLSKLEGFYEQSTDTEGGTDAEGGTGDGSNMSGQSVDWRITTVAGTGETGFLSGGFSGDGGPATAARLYRPEGIAVDGAGNLNIADTENNRILELTPKTGPVAPGGSESFSIADRGGQSTTSSGTEWVTRSGYGRIRPDAGRSTPSGIAIFGFRQGGVLIAEAGVPATEPVREGRIFAEVRGPVNTGLAMANPNDAPATILFHFTDNERGRFGDGQFELGAHQQTAKFLNQAPFNSGEVESGTFTFTSSEPIAVIASRGLTNQAGEFLMTTLPVAPLASTATDTVYFPHFTDGSGWVTQVILVNPTDETIAGKIQFVGQGSGATAAAPANLTLDDGRTGSEFPYSIPAGGSQRFTTSNPPGRATSGSVRATPNPGSVAPSGLVVFSFTSGGKTVSESGVPALPAGSAFRVYAESSGTPNQPGSIRTGLAITNAADTANMVTLEVTDLDGNLAAPPAPLTLPPSGQVARFVDDLFNSLPDDFSGVLRVTSITDIAVVGLRLRIKAAFAVFLSVVHRSAVGPIRAVPSGGRRSTARRLAGP